MQLNARRIASAGAADAQALAAQYPVGFAKVTRHHSIALILCDVM
jgi:hypothetical protein